EGSIVVSGGLGGTGVSGNRAGSGAVGQFSLVTVPEPSALALSVLGGLTLSLIAGATRRVRSLRRSRNGTGTDRR
ncbi:MAG TPA: hypothetical protein VFT74_16815, partial [Isosphaeraceae bacterium]|nr:hypothetical protein [Isosphaeraceae bacterium]